MDLDFSQMKKEYGQNEAEAITSNLNNQFFGRVPTCTRPSTSRASSARRTGSYAAKASSTTNRVC
jgi:type IV secretory pathway TraG/TraD family ATPase VirD4